MQQDLEHIKAKCGSSESPLQWATNTDSEAFELIYETHRELVQRICIRMLRNPFEAEDLTQDVFVQVFRKMHTFRGEAAFSSWLYRVTKNLALLRLRSRRHHSAWLPQGGQEDEARVPEIGTHDPHLTGLFDRMDLDAAIDVLPDGYRAAFVLHDVHGYRHKEISKILGNSVANSKSQLHKARKKLRRLLRCAPPKVVSSKSYRSVRHTATSAK